MNSNKDISPLNKWLHLYFDVIHIISRTYKTDSNHNIDAIGCFILSISDLIPSMYIKRLFKEFIDMNQTTIDFLYSNKIINSFIHINDISEILTKKFFITCLYDSDLCFKWSFLLRAYVHLNLNKEIITFSNLSKTYDIKILNKQSWGNPLWFVIHHTAYNYPPKFSNKWFISYKSFITCLIYVMPCPYCKEHLLENLKELNIDNYKNNIFEYSWSLHNIVNSQLKKPLFSLEDAYNKYNLNN